jgi:aminoglycoside 3-N-acetyltransferase
MSVGKILLRFLSPEHFQKARKLYHNIKSKVYPKLTEESFRKILTEDLGLKKGSVVFIHSAVDNLNLGFPFYRILPILLDIVGEEGTLAFPCWHFNYRAEDYLKKNEIFDVKKSPSVMGILPELARRMKNAKRSLHPLNSVVAVGKYADELTKDHISTEFPSDENSPFYRIMNYNGIIIGLGVSTYNLSFVHCIEETMKEKFPVKTLTDEIFETRVINHDGETIMVKTRAAYSQIKYRNIERFIKKYIPQEICCDFKMNGVKYYKANSRELYNKMEELALKGITIYTNKAKEKQHP